MSKPKRKRLTKNSPVRVSLSLRKWQLDALGGSQKVREYLYNYINAVTYIDHTTNN
jgi:hypothetical protein